MNDHSYCRELLRATRADAKKCRPVIHGVVMADVKFMPTHLTALRTFRDNYLVEGSGGFSHETQACCAWAARASALIRWMELSKRAVPAPTGTP